MQISINGKDYDLNFGVRFVRELDRVAGLKASRGGIEQSFGMGITINLPALEQYDPAILSDVLYCATWDNKKRPSQKDIDDFIDEESTDLDKLFNEVIENMSKTNAVKVAANKIAKNTKAKVSK